MAEVQAEQNNGAVTIYTDGSCLGNPGPGGWAAILQWGEHEKELCDGFVRTTNNRMEILAVIKGLEALKRSCSVDLYTDSQYVRNAIEKGWIDKWVRNGWKTSEKKPVKNQDLWEQLRPLLDAHQVRFHWVRGHDGNEMNERCDVLARECAGGERLSKDPGFAG